MPGILNLSTKKPNKEQSLFSLNEKMGFFSPYSSPLEPFESLAGAVTVVPTHFLLQATSSVLGVLGFAIDAGKELSEGRFVPAGANIIHAGASAGNAVTFLLLALIGPLLELVATATRIAGTINEQLSHEDPKVNTNSYQTIK